mmetsp:Transcript_31825/g.83182  ORF Transcript_31825/g.83182 Transcript_31825/m.83182 type:complete len:256 (+) Transcript_31825:318-1085(+)
MACTKHGAACLAERSPSDSQRSLRRPPQPKLVRYHARLTAPEVALRACQRSELRLCHRKGERPPLRLAQQRNVLVTEAHLVATVACKVKGLRELTRPNFQRCIEVRGYDAFECPSLHCLHPPLEGSIADSTVEDDLNDRQQRGLAVGAVSLEAAHLRVAPCKRLPAAPPERKCRVQPPQRCESNIGLRGSREEEVEEEYNATPPLATGRGGILDNFKGIVARVKEQGARVLCLGRQDRRRLLSHREQGITKQEGL